MRTIAGSDRIAFATVMAEVYGLTPKDLIPWLDQSGLTALLAGSLLVLITFFPSYSQVDIPGHDSIRVNQQIGIPLKIENARLAALESKLDSLLLSADPSSPITPATDCN
jgi:hypothetical protein